MRMFEPENHQEYSEVLASLGAFMEKEILPTSAKLDAGEASIQGPRRALFAQGMAQIPFPADYGGLGLPFSVYSTAVEMLGTADASIALSVEIHNAVAEGILRYWDKPQKKRHLENIIAGKKLASFALTEPASGSDAGTMATTAERKG